MLQRQRVRIMAATITMANQNHQSVNNSRISSIRYNAMTKRNYRRILAYIITYPSFHHQTKVTMKITPPCYLQLICARELHQIRGLHGIQDHSLASEFVHVHSFQMIVRCTCIERRHFHHITST
mmetsp:Transcript_13212/g.19673  ORF Transcript_13212/g.19673 Transcript_13212/m.19673 type:complete len:124 (-) Transcript_13212:99-470(-)